MLSMASPFSSFFSISTISLTPSTTSWTCATSEEPRRSAFEMSNTPPTEAVSTPPKEVQGQGTRNRLHTMAPNAADALQRFSWTSTG
uniref:Uncharacterized protein n=1 Tax=Scophthalmus maximus TaxID=52904 RepID=A0A8D3A127_SCOMX